MSELTRRNQRILELERARIQQMARDSDPNRHKKTIKLDISVLVRLMRERGHDGSEGESGWTNDLMDILEERYELETLVTEALGRPE